MPCVALPLAGCCSAVLARLAADTERCCRLHTLLTASRLSAACPSPYLLGRGTCRGNWDVPQVAERARDIEGKTIGTHGAGRIGREVMKRLQVGGLGLEPFAGGRGITP